ncbi:MAG TPA: AraD1 family protein [Verrucomicrobiae bacterium]|jgi:hypothetical protein
MMRLVQIQKGPERRVALVEEPSLRLLAGVNSIYELAANLSAGASLAATVGQKAQNERLNYDDVYSGNSEWRLRLPMDHPGGAPCCLVSGTGLTHLGSAKNRQAMHSAAQSETDSMKMFRWGVEGGKPEPGKIGFAPEWFYKGNGSVLRGPGEALEIPPYAEDGGEEGEIAGIYIIGSDGSPMRVGMAIGNEFSDHKFEKKNYLNLAGSKLRACAIGPELVVGHDFQSVPGTVAIERGGKPFWSQNIITGEKEMCHHLANIEHHHFKFEGHRRPGDLHVHYFGACSLSFGAGIELADGDLMTISFGGFGRPLRNPLRVIGGEDRLWAARAVS